MHSVTSHPIHYPHGADMNTSPNSYPPQQHNLPQLVNLPAARTTNDTLGCKETTDLEEVESLRGFQKFRYKFFRRSQIKWYFITILVVGLITLITIYHTRIIKALKPFAEDLRELKVGHFKIGWVIPIIILIIISFPPLMGHEIIVLICGLVWGLWIGFGIVSIGTFLGELANFYVFKYACKARAARYEEKNLSFATLSLVIREGGFWIAFLARLSAIPSHLLTPVLATSGMGVWVFSAATILSMPKQLSHVYLGTLFEVGKKTKSSSEKIVEYSVLILSFVVTIVAAVYIYWRMKKVRGVVLENRKINAQRNDGLFPDEQGTRIEPYDRK
ncbi:hypothetical protein DFH28DRAFT_524897 [Melampsora americana]|nr:hypothetical protein DFH28DRAFT_524897 [Melampsora americana]